MCFNIQAIYSDFISIKPAYNNNSISINYPELIRVPNFKILITSNIEETSKTLEIENNFTVSKDLTSIENVTPSAYLNNQVSIEAVENFNNNESADDINLNFESLLKSVGLMSQHVEFILKNLKKRIKIDSMESIRLVYQASIHGFDARNFHEKCNDVPRLLLVIKSCSGYIFGGFSVLAHDSSNICKRDSHSFLFSIINPHKIQPVVLLPQGNHTGLRCIAGNGATFGSNYPYFIDLGLHDKANEFGGWSELGEGKSGYCDVTGKKSALFTGSAKIEKISEILAFTVAV